MCYEPLKCPNCKTPEPMRSRRNGRRRWYKCTECEFTFTTWEQVEAAVEGQAFQAWLWSYTTEANGSREKARDILKGRE
jgi:transposase-like protein